MKLFLGRLLLMMLVLALGTEQAFAGISGPGMRYTSSRLTEEMMQLAQSLTEQPTHLEYTKFQMLKHRHNIEFVDLNGQVYRDYYLKPRGISPLSREYLGVPLTTTGNLGGGGVTQSIDLLTGARAINESLQLDSIGSRELEVMMTPEQLEKYARIRTELNNYRRDNKRYPDRLEDLSPDYIMYLVFDVDYFTDFNYKKTLSSYQLSLANPPTYSIPIESVEGLTIEHHPWEEMLAGASPTVPEIYSLIPADYFFVHFNDPSRYPELEQTIRDISGPLANVYGMSTAVKAQDKILARLGLKPDVFLKYFEEFAFISYDFDGNPATDYAIILRPKASVMQEFLGTAVQLPGVQHGKIGDFYAVTTSQQLFDHLSATADGKVPAMADAMDLRYSLSILDEDRDALAFISDAFVEKVTSPEYRIAARRRNVTLSHIEALQYASFAYLDMHNRWPSSLQEMIKYEYISSSSIPDLQQYSISENGVVSHQTWGSIYEVTPLARVAIETVSLEEKNLYDRFREGYQRFWREFIDPVAISILVGDQISFHTIILPLIDESQYNSLRAVAGMTKSGLNFVTEPDRIPAAQFTSQLDIDSLLYYFYEQSKASFDEVYTECLKDYREQRRSQFNRNRDTTPFQSQSEFCGEPRELDAEAAVSAVKSYLAKNLNWTGDAETMFDFLGDEVMIAAGEDTSFMLNDLSEFDTYIGIELVNREAGQQFLEHVIKHMFGGSGEVYSDPVGVFGVQAGQPIKNTYNNVEYYVLPTGWVNLYYFFTEDRIYLALSQKSINALIDSSKETWPEHMQRVQDYLNPAPHLSLLLDGKKLNTWLQHRLNSELLSYGARREFLNLQTYAKERQLLNATLAETNESIEQFYHFMPKEWFGIPVREAGSDTYLDFATSTISLAQVDVGYRYYLSGTADDNQKIPFEDVSKNLNLEQVFATYNGVNSFGADLSFTEHGLDIKVAFDNLYRDQYDQRVPERERTNVTSLSKETITIIVILIALIFVGALTYLLMLSRRKKTVEMYQTKEDELL